MSGATADAGAVLVRPARPDDLPGLVAVHKQSHYFAQRLARQPGLGILLVAERAAAVVGSAFLRLAPAEEWQLREWLPKVPVLSHVEVAPDYRGNGVGTAIIQAAESEARARQRHRIVLGVRPGDRAAYSRYERLGYADWGRGRINALVVEYDDEGVRSVGTEPCLIMIKSLQAVSS
ncbi:GNAT family N-acetyltransferase [Dactylosporangium sp. NPDC000244]|uniref:GNAT family N-acetyltransferase n=1 Tax=Dactylosporangium sp. NPDC000244 TaxID=3154365 RepID=UPI00331995A3